MPLLISPDNHQYLDYTQDIREICQPLFQTTGITNFLYIRVYQNGKRLQLGTMPDWFLHYVEKDFHQYTCLTNQLDAKSIRYILYSSCMDNVVFQSAVNEFGMHNGIILTNAAGDYNEYFHFTSTKNNNNVLNFYLNNLHILEQFTAYFKEVAKEVINLTKPLVPTKNIIFAKNESVITNTDDSYESLTNQFKIDHLKLMVGKQQVLLTRSELDCLISFLHGNTAKEIAAKIFKSNRTVEHHLKSIKKKLRCRSRAEIYRLIEKNQVFNLLYNYNKF